MEASRGNAERALQNRTDTLVGSVALDISAAESEACTTLKMISDMDGQLRELQLLASTALSAN